MAKITKLQINGSSYAVDAEESTSLLGVLRDQLDLTGSKYGCGEGQCGACTVLVDGYSRRSCITKVGTVADKKITTIEGLAVGDRLHPLQQAFLDEAAMQCAYCTSGMIMSGVALLKRKPILRLTRLPSFWRGTFAVAARTPDYRRHNESRQATARGHPRQGVEIMNDALHLESPLEPERYELSAPPTYRFQVDRRDFFKFLGAGILVVCVLKDLGSAQESGGGRRTGEAFPNELGAWMHIGKTAWLRCTRAKSKSGRTSAPRSPRP